MSEKDFIIRKSEICRQLEDVNAKLGMMNRGAESVLSDEDFIRQASHLLIQRELQDKQYIYFKHLAENVSPEVLKAYMETIIDSIFVVDGKIQSITFKNGLTHRFTYEKEKR